MGLRKAVSKRARQPIADALAAFRTAQPAPRKSIDERVFAGAALEDLLAELMDEVRALDEDRKALKLIDRPLYDGYAQMRRIISPGGGKKEKEAKPMVKPGT